MREKNGGWGPGRAGTIDLVDLKTGEMTMKTHDFRHNSRTGAILVTQANIEKILDALGAKSRGA